MIGGRWLRNWVLWAPPLALLIVGLTLFVSYRVAFASQVGTLLAQVDQERHALAELVDQRQRLEALMTRAERSRSGIEELYEERFSTESERLTGLIREVKGLAERAGLRPTTLTYPDRELDDYELIERAIVFSVEGGYGSLRRFVNFLELSDSFVALRSIRVQQSSGGLALGLELSSLFTGRDQPMVVARSDEAAGGER